MFGLSISEQKESWYNRTNSSDNLIIKQNAFHVQNQTSKIVKFSVQMSPYKCSFPAVILNSVSQSCLPTRKSNVCWNENVYRQPFLVVLEPIGPVTGNILQSNIVARNSINVITLKLITDLRET